MRSRKRERGKTWKKHFSNKSLDKQRKENESWWRKEGHGEKEKRWTKKEMDKKRRSRKKRR